jgi:hypothetical protein
MCQCLKWIDKLRDNHQLTTATATAITINIAVIVWLISEATVYLDVIRWAIAFSPIRIVDGDNVRMSTTLCKLHHMDQPDQYHHHHHHHHL